MMSSTPSQPSNAPAYDVLIDTLPTRLQRLAPLLLTGLNQKQIAAQEGLSYHTVRSYTKELYATLEVSSRQELMVKLRGDTP